MAKGRLVVTGAGGFVGREIVRQALAGGWRVAALVRRETALADLADPGLSIFDWRVGEPFPSAVDLQGADALFHLAAFIPPDFSDAGHADECLRVNALGALRAAEFALKARIGRFLLFSSGQVYENRGRPAREDDPVFPSTRAAYYLGSKLAGEIFVDHLHRRAELPVAVLRLSSVYGRGMKPGGVAPRFLNSAIAGTPIKVADGGTYAADFVHVADVAGAAFKIIERGAGGVFNIGSGESTTTLDLAKAALACAGRPESLIEVERPADRSVGGFAALDISKARVSFGYEPRSLAEGLAEMFAGAQPGERRDALNSVPKQ